MDKYSSIALIDSGLGGLSVLENLIKLYPNENFIYLMDAHNFPYGIKDPELLKHILKKNLLYLEQFNLKLIIIACNTASIHINYLRSLTKINILEVISPTVEKVISLKKRRILVLATKATIHSKVYEEKLKKKLEEDVFIYSLDSQVLVSAVENCLVNPSIIINEHLRSFINLNIDCVVLACTHFQVYYDEIKSFFKNALIISSSMEIGLSLKKTLISNITDVSDCCKQKIKLYTTGNIEVLKNKINLFDISYDEIEAIKID